MSGRTIPLLVLLTTLASMAAGQDAVGPEFRVNSFTTGYQNRPAVSADADGNFVVVWQSYGRDGNDFAASGQRFDRLGNPRGPEFVVNTYTTSGQASPAVAVDASGSFVVAWQSYLQDGSQYGVFARRFDAAGTPLGVSEFRVNSHTTGIQLKPDVAFTPDGGFVVVWESLAQDGSSAGIFGRRFDSAGGALGTEFPINAYTTNAQTWPVVATLPDGGFVVAWQSFPQDGSDFGVFARRFDSSGAPVGLEFQVNSSTTSYQGRPDVAADASGRFVVVWNSYGGDGSGLGVAGQRFDAAGNRLGGEFIVNTTVSDSQTYASVAREAAGDFVVAWSSRQDGDSYGIVAQRFDAGGARIGGEFPVNTFTTSSQAISAVAPLGAERFVVTWQSYLQDGHRWGVFGQRYGDLVFRDNFETGNTSRWSATASDGGDLAVTVGAAMKFTTFGLQAFVDDTAGLYVQDDTPRDETTYRARFYFHPGDFDPGEGQNHFRTRIFIAFEEAPIRRLMALILRRQGGQYALMGRARRDDNSQANTGFFAIGAAQHFVEFRWVRATAPGAGDGVFELWIDGALQASNTTLDSYVSTVDFVRMGALSVKTGASGTVYFDEFESRRETAIGP
jgi:hypothetical protein